MPIKVKSKREDFRRCGIPHTIEEVIYPDDRFTPDEIARLQAEPMLTVERIPIQSSEKTIEVGSESVSETKKIKQSKKRR